MSLLHIAHAEDWGAAVTTGEYRVSTRGALLDEVGFIHASSSAQVGLVAGFAYADDPADLVVLVIDDDALRSNGIAVRYQDGGNGTLYPHIFGALRPKFITGVRPAGFVDGRFAWLRPGGAEAFPGTIAETDVAGAVAAEHRLLDPALRQDRAAVDALLAPEFTEIGRSGRLWGRTELLDAGGGFRSSVGLVVSELEAQVPGPGLVLLRYVSTLHGSSARRSSLWGQSADGWRVHFHQATALAQE
jgi:uncharacterized protein (DUF952 family)